MAPVQDVLAGRYELLEVLGRGGMGVVYRATDRLLDRAVAVKVLPVDRAADPTFVTRFEREALAAAALSHPNIVSVFDSGHDGDTHFIVMECVDGDSLAQLVRRRGQLSADEVVGVAAPVASALGAAHRAGIVHRDVKPANVMVDRRGLVKVLDFGIARAAASAPLTQTAIVLGSAPYLAPEVSQGRPADARSDIYSLGCVVYELLTGRPPFTGDVPAAILHQHNTATPRPPGELSRAVPAGLDTLVMRMLAKDPNQRPQHAGELAEAFPLALDDATAPTAVLPPARRRRPLLGKTERLGLGVALLLVIVGLAIALLGSSSSPHKAAAAHSRQSASHAVARHLPTTVAGAAGALTALTTRDLQAGRLDQRAAQAILARLQDVMTASDHGQQADALRHVADLGNQVTALGSHGDIKQSAMPAMESAISNLRSVLERTAPPSAGAAPAPAPAPHHGQKPPGHGHGHGKDGGD